MLDLQRITLKNGMKVDLCKMSIFGSYVVCGELESLEYVKEHLNEIFKVNGKNKKLKATTKIKEGIEPYGLSFHIQIMEDNSQTSL